MSVSKKSAVFNMHLPYNLQMMHALQTYQCLNQSRTNEIHHHHISMKQQKQHQYSFEPIIKVATKEQVFRNPSKPFTSFNISDILDKRSDTHDLHQEQNSKDHKVVNGIVRKQNHELQGNNEINSNQYNNERIEFTERHKILKNSVISDEPKNVLKKSIVRPWIISSRSSTPNTDDNKHSNTYSSNDQIQSLFHSNAASKNYLLKRCNKYRRLECETKDDEEIDVERCDDNADDDSDNSVNSNLKSLSPLDALIAMSSKTFRGLDSFEKRKNNYDGQSEKNQPPKKKRKTRTAFTNQQIYELEKRFILQKYLTSSDRDEIAAKLGLTCAQVITWFQNRRAKFKRDFEELKIDVVATSTEQS